MKINYFHKLSNSIDFHRLDKLKIFRNEINLLNKKKLNQLIPSLKSQIII